MTEKNLYVCKSCQTSFFIDSDDYTVKHEHTVKVADKRTMLIWFFAIGVVLFFFIAPVLGLLLGSRTTTSNETWTAPSYTPPPVPDIMKEEGYQWTDDRSMSFYNDEHDPIVLVVGMLQSRNFVRRRDDEQTIYFGLWNIKTGEKLAFQELDKSKKDRLPDLSLNRFDDGLFYVVLNGARIWQIDPTTKRANRMNTRYSEQNDELVEGIAKAKVLSDGYGSGFELVNNLGHTVMYMPLINEAYTKKAFNERVRKKLPDPTHVTAYTFSSVEHEYPNERSHLVKYTYAFQPGFPRYKPRFGWQKEYAHYGIITDRTPYKKVFILRWMAQEARVEKWEILLEDRNFPRGGTVYDAENGQIFIGYKATPSDDEDYQLQVIDEKGKILHHLPVGEHVREGVMSDNGLIYRQSSTYHYYEFSTEKTHTLVVRDLVINKK